MSYTFVLKASGITVVPPSMYAPSTCFAFLVRNASVPSESVPTIVISFVLPVVLQAGFAFASSITLPFLPASALPASASVPLGGASPLAIVAYAAFKYVSLLLGPCVVM